MICNGRMLSTNGRNRNLYARVKPSLLLLFVGLALIFAFYAVPAMRALKPKGYWRDVASRRAFFVEFAQSKGFDTLDFQRWKDFSYDSVVAQQVL